VSDKPGKKLTAESQRSQRRTRGFLIFLRKPGFWDKDDFLLRVIGRKGTYLTREIKESPAFIDRLFENISNSFLVSYINQAKKAGLQCSGFGFPRTTPSYQLS